jgi:predicted O-methyltransferase YrrM
LPGRVVLVDGDIAETAPSYVNASPGFKISLLHLDLDAAAPTLAALEAFWPRLSRGGVVIFDEYAIDKWSESQAVDAFFADKDVEIKTLPYGRTPTAYVVKM